MLSGKCTGGTLTTLQIFADGRRMVKGGTSMLDYTKLNSQYWGGGRHVVKLVG